MEERKYAYLKDQGIWSYCIVYKFGDYYVAQMVNHGERGVMITFLRKYKTVSGAERYLLNKCGDDTTKETLYGTKKFIEEGSYWRT